MGRDSTGVRGVKLGEGQSLISLIVIGDGHILTASANGEMADIETKLCDGYGCAIRQCDRRIQPKRLIAHARNESGQLRVQCGGDQKAANER